MIGLIEGSEARRREGWLCALTQSVFRPGGWLEVTLGLDHRPQQAAMAEAVAAALESDQALLFEAGTGVGKSLAYLIPGLIHAVAAKRPMVVSSHTISLQEQIRNKDLELCRTLFQKVPELTNFAGFKTALMVGRGNYCCTTRLSRAFSESGAARQGELFAGDERDDLARIAEWAATSAEGLLQELSPPPLPGAWDAVNADSSTCSRKHCDPSTCFYQRARRRLEGAQCVIVNHSLLFSLINAGMPPDGDEARGVLFADDFVVLDEAHRVPAIATDHFGLHLSSFGVDRALKRLYNPRTRRGVLARHGDQWDRAAVEQAIEASAEFFDYLGDSYLRERTVQRMHDPGFCENTVSGPLAEVARRLGALGPKIEDEVLRAELRDHRRRVSAQRDGIRGFIDFAAEGHVRWLERGGRSGRIVTLRSAPLDVAPCLREALFRRRTGVILTSATLSDGHRMDRFRDEVGAEAAETRIEYSPFDYEKNCLVFVAEDAPGPTRASGRLDLDYLAEAITWCAARTTGGTLVLFTSHADLRAVAERAAPVLAEHGRPLFTQGHGHGRSELTRRFAAAGDGVLFGTDSFWTGVDVPGPALSQVILARLPFENPSHPVIEARAERIQALGGNPFAEMTVPAALVKFRQGLGRLIRTAGDRGNLVILDSRIVNRPYGRNFIAALPRPGFARFNRGNREAVFAKAF